MTNTVETHPGHPIGSELGQKSAYDGAYNPDRLYPIPRAEKRQEIGIDPDAPPFFGFDCWNHYEVSWLNPKGKPIVALAEIVYDCKTPKIIESKSLKLYFNSFNSSQFSSSEEVAQTVATDLQTVLEANVSVVIKPLSHTELNPIQQNFSGICVDHLDIECTQYTVDPTFLAVGHLVVQETLYSDLLKSNCLVTNQPDWGSVQICYRGPQIDRAGLLRYLVSFRHHNEFHEQCIERIFVDIMNQCHPEQLAVYGRYTRRGGLDINPFRSTKPTDFHKMNTRLIRQ